jgi:hypothetical protein
MSDVWRTIFAIACPGKDRRARGSLHPLLFVGVRQRRTRRTRTARRRRRKATVRRDPARGTHYAPVWHDVPVSGSSVAKMLASLAGVRTQVAFDDEGQDDAKTMRSLHARAAFDVR